MPLHAHNKHKLGKNINSSFLAFIPKEENPISFNKLCSISICNSSYKILTKIMANRVKKILPKIISNNQGDFMQKRKIIDNVIMVQEEIH